MNKANTLKECFAILISEYGDRLTPEQVNLKKELFNNVIGNYSPEKIKKMTMEMIRYRKYANFPKIAEMVELIEGNQEEETELAWNYLLEMLNKYGYYHSVRFPKYPAIGGFIESQGGWVNFSNKMTEAEDQGKEVWIKKEFEKSYKAFKSYGNYPEYFEGYFELENTKKGYTNQKLIERYGMSIDGRKKNVLKIEEKKK
ncbi:MAG: hypothetical protein ACOCUH_02795 [Bacteriovoracia bacterium]